MVAGQHGGDLSKTDGRRLAAVGSYSSADADGVHTVAVAPESGTIELLDSVAVGPDPTYVVPHPDGRHLYAAVRESDGGVIKTLAVDRDRGELTPVAATPSGSDGPCYCSVDATGRFLFVAHYHGGAVSMLPIGDDGVPAEPSAVVEHTGSSVDPQRQTEPHPHSVVPGPDNRFVYVPDLGTDRVVVYEVRPDDRTLSSDAVVDVAPGSGPRHLTFGPDGERAYLINEINSTVVAFARRPDGTLAEQATVSTLPDGADRDNKTAEVAVHPSGRYVFGSNRGHDSIVTFAVEDGSIVPVDHTPTGGKWPRHFAVGPAGEFLYVENKDSHEVTAFSFDDRTGGLSPAAGSVSVSRPVCLQWL